MFGFAFVAAILAPNIVYAITNKSTNKTNRNSKVLETVEQIGRYGCILFMTINVPKTFFGWRSDEAFALYIIINSILTVAYCVLWVVLWKKDGVFKALSLSIIPSVIFLFSAISLRSVPLEVASLLFASAHIMISYKNANLI